MPIYEYQCESCGERIEELQKMADPPLTECRTCGGPLKRLISSPAVQFKGTGWYVTDYAGKKGSGSGGDSTSSSGDSASSSDSSASSSSSGGETGKAAGSTKDGGSSSGSGDSKSKSSKPDAKSA